MNRNALYVGFWTLVLLLLSSCSSKPTSRELFEAHRKYDKMYRNADLTGADECMREYLDYLLEQKEMGAEEINYNYALGLVYGRLFAINELEGKEEDTDLFFEKSAYWLNEYLQATRRPKRDFTRESLRRKIEAMDSLADVRWRSEASGRRE